MYQRDRLASLVLLGAAVAAWVAVGFLFTTYSPSDASLRAGAALLLGVATALTVTPLAWLVVFAQRRIAYRGDWTRAARRGLLAGGVVTVLVLLRLLEAFSLPIAIFVVAMAVFVELILTARR